MLFRSDRIETGNENLIVFWIKKITDYVTIDELSKLLVLGLFLLMVIAVLSFIFPSVKAWARGVQFLLILLLIGVIVILEFKWVEVKDPSVVVLDKEVYIHYGPSNKETKAFVLHEGAKARLLDKTDDWLYIILENKNSGWIPKASCEII